MARPSSFQSLGGPLGDTRLEFGSGDLLVGSDSDCQIRIVAPGVAARHAQLVITSAGASIQRLDGPVGINDDLVATEATLRSGDFVWIGEPGGDASIMLQFTLGDVEEIASPPSPVVRTILPPVEFSEAEPLGDDLAVASEEEAVVEDLAAAPEGSEEVVGEIVEELVVEESLDQTIALTAASEPVEMSDSDSVVQEADLLQLDETDLPGAEAIEAPEDELAPAGMEVAELDPAEAPEPEPEPEPEVEPESVELDSQTEAPDLDGPPPEILDPDPVDLDALADAEAAFEDPLGELPALPPPPLASPSVPLAPWQVPASPPAAQESPAEYASAWESAPPTAALPTEANDSPRGAAPPSEPAPPPPPAAAAPPPPPPPPRPSPPPAPKPKVRSVEQDAALRTPPPPRPPARTTSSTSAIMGGLAVVVVLGGAALFFLREAPAPVAPVAIPTPVPVATAVVAPPGPAEPAGTAAVTEPIPPAPTPVQAGAAPVTTSTPPPRATPTPARAAATPPPAPAAAAPATPAAAVAAAAPAPASQVPRLLEEARSAAQAGDLSKSSQLFDQVLKLQPGNPEAASRKADVDVRIAALAKKFSVSGTTVIGGKAAKGPTGFDLGGGGAVQREYSAQIRCTSTPAAVEPGKAYSVNCSILNVGTKSFKLEAVTLNEAADGARSTGAGVIPRQDIAPQSSAVILERSGTWTAKSQWSLDVLAKSNKDESFRAIYSWR